MGGLEPIDLDELFRELSIWNHVCEVNWRIIYYENWGKIFELLDAFVDQIREANVVLK